jgi:hypothetical protein
MKRLFFSIFVTLLFSLSAFAQSEGINFQGVARNAAGEVLVSQKINLRLSILLGSETGTVAYMETRLATTNPQGVFAVVVGDDKALTKSTNFSTINWTPSPKFIKVEMDPNAGANYLVMGTSRLQAVPFAFYANGVDASNVKGVLPVSKGGTGVTSMTDLKTSLGLDNFNNAALDTKVDKVAGKGLSSNDYTTAEKNKLEAITGTNTGDQDLSGYATTAQVATKANAADMTASLATKANTADVTTSLANKVDKVASKGLSTNDYTTAEKTKLAAITGTNTGDQDLSAYATIAMVNAIDVNSSLTGGLTTKVDKVTGKGLSTNDYTTAEKNKLAAITGTNTGDQDLSGYATTLQLATKANASDVTTSLATKEDSSNKSNAALGTSTTFYPTQNAVKTYVDAQILTATIADADATTRGKIQLAGDLTGSSTSPAIASGAVTSTKIQDATIVNADIATAAAIEDTKLATIATSGKVSNSATTATSVNTNSAIVARDASGNFNAGTITANLTGNVTGNLTGNATNVSGTVAVANGGTGLISTPTNGQILIGNGTGFTLATLSAGTGITITNTTGSISIAASAAAVRPTTDQFSATANQLTFTLTQTPLTNANSKDNVWMFINGVRTNNDAYSVSGTTVTYVPGSNGSYALLAGDRIQFDYAY